MKALILAAGLGTRLRPLTDTIPKPLVPIAGVPLLQYHLDHLRHHGVTDVLINTHYLAEQMSDFIAEYLSKSDGSLNVTLAYEPVLLGSGGTLKANQNFFADSKDFLVVYSDNLTDIDYSQLLAKHQTSDSMVTIASYYEHFPEQKGIIEHNNDGVIIKFIEKPQTHKVTSNFANAGIYVVSKKIFEVLSELEYPILDFGHHVFPELLTRGEIMRIYAMNETLLDIGNHENYTKAQTMPAHMKFKK
jgi:mannose-1-phosphate guanylyltransferase